MKQDILNHPYHFKLLLEIFQFILLLALLSLLAFLSTGSWLFRSMFDKGCCSCFVIIFFPILQQIQAISVLNTVSFTIDSLSNIANLQDLIIGNTILIELSCFNIAAVSRTAWRVEKLWCGFAYPSFIANVTICKFLKTNTKLSCCLDTVSKQTLELVTDF